MNFTPVNNEIRNQLQEYWELLKLSLRDSIRNDWLIINEFVSSGQEELKKLPQTVDELGKANDNYRQLKEQWCQVGRTRVR